MKIQSPWMGRIKGSAGNMTGCKVYDKNVMRARAFEVNNPNTAAQQVQRGYFAELTKLVAGFTSDQLRTLFPSRPKSMSRRNALSKQLAEYNTMEGTKKVVDFANIDTLGNAPTARFEINEMLLADGNYNIMWDTEEIPSEVNEDDQVIAALVNISKKEMILSNKSAEASQSALSIPNTMNWEESDTVHALLFATNMKEANQSFGSFIIKVRPEKKSN